MKWRIEIWMEITSHSYSDALLECVCLCVCVYARCGDTVEALLPPLPPHGGRKTWHRERKRKSGCLSWLTSKTCSVKLVFASFLFFLSSFVPGKYIGEQEASLDSQRLGVSCKRMSGNPPCCIARQSVVATIFILFLLLWKLVCFLVFLKRSLSFINSYLGAVVVIY